MYYFRFESQQSADEFYELIKPQEVEVEEEVDDDDDEEEEERIIDGVEELRLDDDEGVDDDEKEDDNVEEELVDPEGWGSPWGSGVVDAGWAEYAEENRDPDIGWIENFPAENEDELANPPVENEDEVENPPAEDDDYVSYGDVGATQDFPDLIFPFGNNSF